MQGCSAHESGAQVLYADQSFPVATEKKLSIVYSVMLHSKLITMSCTSKGSLKPRLSLNFYLGKAEQGWQANISGCIESDSRIPKNKKLQKVTLYTMTILGCMTIQKVSSIQYTSVRNRKQVHEACSSETDLLSLVQQYLQPTGSELLPSA